MRKRRAAKKNKRKDDERDDRIVQCQSEQSVTHGATIKSEPLRAARSTLDADPASAGNGRPRSAERTKTLAARNYSLEKKRRAARYRQRARQNATIEERCIRNDRVVSNQVLDVGFNLMSQLPENAFSPSSQLTLLALDGNPLATLPRSAFGHLNGTLRGLSLGGRFLACDCKLRWIAEWIRDTDLQVTSRERNPQFCGSPVELRTKSFYQLAPQGTLLSTRSDCSINGLASFFLRVQNSNAPKSLKRRALKEKKASNRSLHQPLGRLRRPSRRPPSRRPFAARFTTTRWTRLKTTSSRPRECPWRPPLCRPRRAHRRHRPLSRPKCNRCLKARPGANNKDRNCKGSKDRLKDRLKDQDHLDRQRSLRSISATLRHPTTGTIEKSKSLPQNKRRFEPLSGARTSVRRRVPTRTTAEVPDKRHEPGLTVQMGGPT